MATKKSTTQKKLKIDRAAVKAAEEMVRLPNTNWDYPNRREEVLAVARNYLELIEALKARRKTP